MTSVSCLVNIGNPPLSQLMLNYLLFCGVHQTYKSPFSTLIIFALRKLFSNSLLR